MPEYLLIGDIHLSDRPPSSCFDSYQDDIFDLLAATMRIAKERQVRAIIWAGDVWHHKTPGRTAHGTVIRLIDLVLSSGIKHYVVPGNHDLLNDRLASLKTTQPLGVVIASGAVELLHGWMLPTTLDHDGVLDQVYGVPWLMRFDDDTVSEALADYREHYDGEHTLVVTHAPLYPPGLELPYENYPAHKWAEAMGGNGSVYYGHVHEAAGIFTVNGVTFCNPGALSRGSLHEHNLTRKVSCAIWSSDTGEFEIVEVPHKPADQVFKLAEAVAKKADKLSLDAFLTSVRETKVNIASIDTVIEHVRGMGLDDALERILLDLLDDVR